MATDANTSTITVSFPNATITSNPIAAAAAVIPAKVINPNLPDHKYQVFQRNLLEEELPLQDAFIAARIQRMQHGIYTEPGRLQIYGVPENEMKVTFLAITFQLQPMHSTYHRFMRAIISITTSEGPVAAHLLSQSHPRTANGNTNKERGNSERGNSEVTVNESVAATQSQILRIVKFSPHTAFGSVSTENLKWAFSVNSTVGTGAAAPLAASITPGTSFDKTKVIGAMLKIQGTTRSCEGVQSSKLVWSIEENKIQKSGLPREFTFVCLVERKDMNQPLSVGVSIKPSFSNSWSTLFRSVEIRGVPVNLGKDPIGQAFVALDPNNPSAIVAESSYGNFNFGAIGGGFDDLLQMPGDSVRLQEEPGPTGGIPAPGPA